MPQKGGRVLDFDAAWKHYQKTTKAPDSCQRWNKKAARYDSRDSKNLYTEAFLELAEVKSGETVFDMGCGTGSLAIAVAERGHAAIAADFSEGMLEKMSENMEIHGVAHAKSVRDIAPGTICTLHMSWEDDWSAVGLNENMADVAFASRSIAVADLRAALRKLCLIARRRCCITMTTGVSPRIDQKLLEELGVKVNPSRDYLYAFGMLAQAGFEPEVRFIHSKRKDSFASAEDAFGDFSQMIEIGRPDLSANELEEAKSRLRLWLSEHLVENPEAGQPDKKGYAQGPLTLDVERIVPWAFISWDPKGATL